MTCEGLEPPTPTLSISFSKNNLFLLSKLGAKKFDLSRFSVFENQPCSLNLTEKNNYVSKCVSKKVSMWSVIVNINSTDTTDN
jgi:hypothetical protein